MSSTVFICVSIIIVLIEIGMTAGLITLWKTMKEKAPETLPKIYFMSVAVRLLVSLLLFVGVIIFIREDISLVKYFTVAFVALYFILMTVDTMYFYCSSQLMSKKTN